MTRFLGISAGLFAAGIWGGMYVVSKVVLDVIPPFTLLSLRLLLGIAVLAPALLPRWSRRASRRAVVEAMLVGSLGFGVSLGLQFVGTRLSTASNAALVTSASPAFMVAFAALILGERVTGRRILALILATLGVIAVINPRAASFDLDNLWGDLALLGAALTWGLYSVLVKRASRSLPVVQVSLFSFLGGMFLAVPASFLELGGTGVGAIPPGHWLGVLYLGIVSTALAMYLWNKSLAMLEASVVSVLFFAQPVVGVGLGAALLGEQLRASFWLGAAFIGLGLGLTARQRRPYAGEAERTSAASAHGAGLK